MSNRVTAFITLLLLLVGGGPAPASPVIVQFLFTSDAHYGITRARFRGRRDVDARVVNAAMVARMNGISRVHFPTDGQLRAGEAVGPIDFVAETGDIANREETAGGLRGGRIQTAATSWSQFVHDYVNGLTLVDALGERSQLFVAPGNHDVSNAVGFYKPMTPLKDASAMAAIYTMMMRPPAGVTANTYRYDTGRVRTARDVGGVHLVFMNVWPDSEGRAWLGRDLEGVAASTPVLIFTHDQPEAEAKHFTNPNGRHDINPDDKFENLLTDRLADGRSITDGTAVEQRELERFLRDHANIRGYFHGNANGTEFYDWRGPGRTIALPTFRVDSPMKGAQSAQDERRLAFEVATVDMGTRRMTVRECLWNAEPENPAAPVKWGAARTVSLAYMPPSSADGP